MPRITPATRACTGLIVTTTAVPAAAGITVNAISKKAITSARLTASSPWQSHTISATQRYSVYLHGRNQPRAPAAGLIGACPLHDRRLRALIHMEINGYAEVTGTSQDAQGLLVENGRAGAFW